MTPYQKVSGLYFKFLDDLYDLLVTEAGADPERRSSFKGYMADYGGNPRKEYRFKGALKGGGKIWMDNQYPCPYFVSCYPEDYLDVGSRVVSLNDKIKALHLDYVSKSREV